MRYDGYAAPGNKQKAARYFYPEFVRRPEKFQGEFGSVPCAWENFPERLGKNIPCA